MLGVENSWKMPTTNTVVPTSSASQPRTVPRYSGVR